jgi:hypothetical protein
VSKSFGNKHPRKEHLVRDGGGLAGEVADLRSDVEEAFTSNEKLENGSNAMTLEELLPAIKAAAFHMASSVFTSVERVLTGTDLTGAKASPPRNVVVGVTIATTGGTGTITVKGTDVNGDAIQEDFTIPGTTGNVIGVCAMETVTEVDIPAHGGHFTGSVVVGTGDKIGLKDKIKTRSGGAMVIQEIYDGNRVTNGVFALATVGLPNGTYAPNTPPNGTHSYTVLYERDPS